MHTNPGDSAAALAAMLATTLANRVCHDVAGLLGTLAGTLELADEDEEARQLATETANTLIARVRLLRAAWGGGAGPLDAAAIGELAEGLPGVERLRLDASGLPGEMAEAPSRLILCLLLAALPGLPRGGSISMEAISGGAIRIRLSGQEAAWPEALAICAAHPASFHSAHSPRTLAAPLACLLAQEAGWQIAVEGGTVILAPN